TSMSQLPGPYMAETSMTPLVSQLPLTPGLFPRDAGTDAAAVARSIWATRTRAPLVVSYSQTLESRLPRAAQKASPAGLPPLCSGLFGSSQMSICPWALRSMLSGLTKGSPLSPSRSTVSLAPAIGSAGLIEPRYSRPSELGLVGDSAPLP